MSYVFLFFLFFSILRRGFVDRGGFRLDNDLIIGVGIALHASRGPPCCPLECPPASLALTPRTDRGRSESFLPFERRGAVRRNSKEKNLKRDLSISRGAALLKEPFFPSQQLSLVCVHCTVLYVSVGCIGNCFFLFQKMYCVVLDRRIVRNAPGVAASSYVSARLAWKRHETLAFPLFPSFTSLYVSKHLTFVCATSEKKADAPLPSYGET